MDDLIDGLVRLMESRASFTGPVNIGNDGEFTIRELAELVLAETGSSSKLVNLALPRDDPRQRRPNISLAKAELGWQPTIRLQDGLNPTVAFFSRDQARRSRKPEEQYPIALDERDQLINSITRDILAVE